MCWRRPLGELFQELEAGTGPSLSERIDVVHEARSRDVATRRLPLTGVSEFPDLDETPVERPPLKFDAELSRLTEPFEVLRDAADSAPSTLSVFLANLGPPAVHTARSSFASNLLAAGGIETLGNGGFDSPAAAAAAWAEEETPVAVVCSSDKVYEEHAAATVAALKDAGCGHVLLAGRPGRALGGRRLRLPGLRRAGRAPSRSPRDGPVRSGPSSGGRISR